MRDGPRRLPLIALCTVAALIALILAGAYIYRERGSTGVLVDNRGPGAGGQTTEVFSVDGAWDLRWSYDCSPSLDNPFRKVDRCDFFLTVKQMSDCQVSPQNQGINQQHRVKGEGVVHYHAGGTFYFVVESDGSWSATVIGSGRAWGVGPAPHCSEG